MSRRHECVAPPALRNLDRSRSGDELEVGCFALSVGKEPARRKDSVMPMLNPVARHVVVGGRRRCSVVSSR
jgi:hypothetical protein